MGRVFFCIDNVLAKTRQELDTIERVYEDGFLAGLEHYKNMISVVNELIIEQKREVFFFANVPQGLYRSEERELWIKKHLPQANPKNIITYPTGADLTAYIPLGMLPGDVLVSSYTKDLDNWSKKRGTSVKFFGEKVLPVVEKGYQVQTSYSDDPKMVAKAIGALTEAGKLSRWRGFAIDFEEVVELYDSYSAVHQEDLLEWMKNQKLSFSKEGMIRNWYRVAMWEKSVDEKNLVAACATIHQYEANVRRSPRYCYVDIEGKLKLGIYMKTALEFGKDCGDYIKFKESMKEAKEGQALLVRRTPKMLQKMGFSNLPMYYTVTHLKEALNAEGKHPISEILLMKLPELLSKPIAVWRTSNAEQKERYLLLFLEKNIDGDPLVAVVQPFGTAHVEGKQVPSNFIVSFYARTPIYEDLKTAAAENRFLWYDFAALERLLGSMGYHCPREIDRKLSGKILEKISNPKANAIEIDEKRTLPPVKNTTQKTAAQVGAVKRGAKKI